MLLMSRAIAIAAGRRTFEMGAIELFARSGLPSSVKRAYLQIVLDGSAADNEAVPGGDAPKVLCFDGLLVLDLMALEAKRSTRFLPDPNCLSTLKSTGSFTISTQISNILRDFVVHFTDPKLR